MNTSYATTSQRKPNSLWVKICKNKHIYILLLPALITYFLFYYVPMGGLVIAFQKFSITKGIFKSPYVGFENFKNFLSDVYFWRLLKNTLTINLLKLLIGFPIPIIFALLLNEINSNKFKKVVQTVTYMPHFLSVVVVVSIVLTFVSSNGFINALISMLGGEKISFMSRPEYFRTIYIASDIWQEMGWSSILYISALSGIDQSLYEAAVVDGAGRWKKLLHVTLPGITEIIMITLIMSIGRMLSLGYDKIILMYNPAIYETADVISTYVYRRGLINADYSYAAAVGMFNSIFNFMFLMAANKISNKATGSGLW